MRKPERMDGVDVSVRALLAITIARDRRDGVPGDEIAAAIARSGMSYADIGDLLGTGANAARLAVQRGRKKTPARKRSQ